MKNVITIDVDNPYYYQLNTIEGENSIFIHYRNHSKSAKCEIYYRDTYQEELSVENDGYVRIPEQCYSDGCIVHIRYKNGKKTSFFHIVGDGSRYKNLVLEKQGNCVAVIKGQQEQDKETVKDYWIAIAKLISATMEPNGENCTTTLNGIRQYMIGWLLGNGIEVDSAATMTEIASALNRINNKLKRQGDKVGLAINIYQYKILEGIE